MGYTGEKKREYQRQWLAARRAEWFKDKVCIDCGWDRELELDHVDRETKVDHRVWSWSAERREIELAKCVVRCLDCHQERTIKQFKTRKHGDRKTYWKDNCRCLECTKANTEHVKKVKNRRV